MNSAPVEFWQEHIEFTVTNQRVSTDKGKMERSIVVDQTQHSLYQRILFIVHQLAKSKARVAQMRSVVGITSWTPERALPRDFNG
jgi:hypothetical protein